MTGISFTTAFPHPYNKIGDGPEGPEVRTVADKLRPLIVGALLVDFASDGLMKCDGWEKLRKFTKITSVSSYGKKILLELEELTIIVSLGMTGRLWFQRSQNSHIIWKLRNEKGEFELVFDDSRRFGSIEVVPDVAQYLTKLGPDLLAQNEPIAKEIWDQIFQKKHGSSRAISDVLVDQSLVAGIGWYLMTEILYFCRIHPLRKTKDLSSEDWENLRIVSSYIIHVSYSYGGLTIESFISPDGEPGRYPASVYGRTEDPLGRKVTKYKSRKQGRTLHFVENI